jgi:hypothetical protein
LTGGNKQSKRATTWGDATGNQRVVWLVVVGGACRAHTLRLGCVMGRLDTKRGVVGVGIGGAFAADDLYPTEGWLNTEQETGNVGGRGALERTTEQPQAGAACVWKARKLTYTPHGHNKQDNT